jgi:2-polyprenyl-6-methoxyphenol hydroxylase-like FAD-dependent oxidoreductase
VRIEVIGGGPAGLFFAILMKARDPSRRVTVRERSPRGVTWGWGVVFSDKTMSYLRDADRETHDAITGAFETWDNVDIVHRGEKVSVRGNRFSGIARLAMLEALERRALALGVEVRHEESVADPAALEALAREADLLVGADGVASAVRAAREERFGPRFDPRANRYIWLGTPRLFHGLTLTFREMDGALFIAHSYKFSREMSTFIVEVDPAGFERAGLAALGDDEARALLERAFAPDLAGAPLLSNRSKWLRFAMLRTERWHDGNVVLLGDAIHTVHFSIGSGTKLALEDAIALAAAFDARPRVADALPAFEAARRPVVEEYQAAAEESLAWFERAGELLHLAPEPFAWSCMTRSGRVDRESLLRRDPAFVARVDAWRDASARAAPGGP